MRPIILLLMALLSIGGCHECEDNSALKCFFEQDGNRIEKLGGIWRGTLTHSEISDSQSIVAIVSEENEIRLISIDGIQASGRIVPARRSATGDLRFYPSEGETFSEDREILTGEFEGSAEEATTLNGDWVASVDTDINGRFVLTYDAVYAEDSSLDRLAGNYSAQTSDGFSRSLVIQNTGEIEGSDSDGCLYSGDGETIDTDWNAYELAISITGCNERSGDFRGLAYLDKNGSVLTLQITGGTEVLSMTVSK